MMNPTSPERIRQDGRLIGQALLKLALPRLIFRVVVVAIAAVIWLLVAAWLLAFGKSLSFEGMHALGQQAVDMLTRVNPYFWWGVVAIWSLIVFFSIRAWLGSSIAAGRAAVVPTDVLSDLAPRLSPEVLDVLRWVWGEREEPLTVGDLQRAHTELRHNHIGKIALVREQSGILDAPAHRPGPDERHCAARHAEPRINEPRAVEPRLAEPHIGPAR
ncbi:hypothetical protein [Bordetella pertussis]|uniref:hypothetical protein n=1 Tax=Bordetella pertussis TaxID=520 RepID=UPI00097DC8AD|nr:hypothetical protein [Bordetella pertussis]AQI17534.1 hypothetical protein ASC29_00690 [Bordetella pertussis]